MCFIRKKQPTTKLTPLAATLTKMGREQTESCCFPHQDIKATRCQEGEDLLWDKNPANNGKLQDVFAIVKDGIIAQVGAESTIQNSHRHLLARSGFAATF